MAITTIYSSKATHLDGENVSTNYGNSVVMRVGQQTIGFSGSGARINSIFEFDVSSLTEPSQISQARLVLTNSGLGGGMTGNTVRSIYAYRLDQDFVEDEATWQIASTGVDWTGGTTVGGASNIATTQYSESSSWETFSNESIGFRVTTSPIILDITALVVDAIQKRGGTLRFWIGYPLSDTSTTRAEFSFHSNEAVTEDNRPKLQIYSASKIVWDGSAGDGNAQTASNYVGDVAPDSYDHVIFNDGAIDVTNGSIYCNSLFISKGYKGNIEATDGSALLVLSGAGTNAVLTNKVVINQGEGRFNLQFSTTNLWQCKIANCPDGGGRLHTSYTGKHKTTVIKTTGALELSGDFDLSATGSKTGTKHITTSGNATDIKALHTKLTVSNGCDEFILGDGTRMNCTGDEPIAQSGTSKITDNSYVSFLGIEIDSEVQILNGTLSFKGNENATITTQDIPLWKNGYFDTRTNTGAWASGASPHIDCRGGGKFVVDVGRTITVT